MRPYMEKILGRGPTQTPDQKAIPGAVQVAGVEVRYVEDEGKDKFLDDGLFQKVTRHPAPRHAKSGGANTDGCKIYTPDGKLFHALSYHADIEGWRQDITESAKTLGLRLARIVADELVVIDESARYALADCKMEFY